VSSQEGLISPRRRGLVFVASLAASLAIASGIAFGEGGGISAPGQPEIRDLSCQNRCAGVRAGAAGSTIELRGRSLEHVDEVTFNAKSAGRVSSKPTSVAADAIEVEVPDGAATGKPRAIDSMGREAESPAALEIVPESEIASGAGFRVRDLAARPDKGYFAGRRRATANFIVDSGSAQDVRVDVLADDGSVVSSVIKEDQAPGARTKISWNGKTDAGEVAPNGEYKFEVKPLGGGEGDRVDFEQYDHQFPVRGPHTYGDGLGAGRGHRGQDLAADCNRRLVAARAGKVTAKGYQASGAGNYVVIDGKGTDLDYVYMHMIEPAAVDNGDKVKTGEKVGKVGSTGRSTGCHLHFELWRGGWYSGGEVIDPTPHLKRWDEWS
jgi:murein DD-endopeptidase MepM/ murein hydrolase activator NlpD